MTLRNAFGDLALDSSVQDVVDKLSTGAAVNPVNVSTGFRETFEAYSPGAVWTESKASGDIIQLDGNAVASSYLVISKDPLTAGTESSITTISELDCPIELVSGHALSQRVLGQELSMELVSSETALSSIADVAISSISQTTTTLTVTTSTAHGFSSGQRIGIVGITSDSRLNYPALVVSSVVSTTVFTATAGPAGTIPSLTVGPYTNQGSVYYRPAMGYAQEGVSQIFESTSATQASVYIRSDAGDALPGGTLAGNHSFTVATSASVSAITAANTYAFQPSSEYRFLLTPDRVQTYDIGVDSATATNSRITRSQIVPSNAKKYKLRYRFTNNKALTVPTAKIVSATKAASTTATIVTATPHGFTTGDYVVVYGIRDQTNFANATTPGSINVVNSTTFQLSFGASATATSYGGMVARANGANVPAAFQAPVVQSVSVSNWAGYGNALVMIGSASWGVVIGDYVNVYGVRDNSTGADIGLDGVYKVSDVGTTTLVLLPIGSTATPTTLASTNCGGMVIKRTDVRISFVRAFSYQRERVEILPKPAADQQGSMSVYISGGTLGQVTSVNGGAIGTQAYPNQIAADITSAALTSTATSAAITPSNGAVSHEFNVIVTATSGTNQTLDMVVQESDDSGTNWYDVYHFPRITAVGQYRSPLIPLTGNRIRYVRTITGTSPSFTNSVNRQQSQVSAPLQRQFFDRTIVPTTLNSVTPSFFTEGCVDINLLMSFGTMTTAPVLVLEGSLNNVDWYQIGTDITPTASATSFVAASNAQNRFTRIRVKTAGATIVFGYVAIKGIGR